MVLRSQMDRDPHANLFHLLVAFLRKLNEPGILPENVFFWYQIRFLKWLGFKPNLRACQKCRTEHKQDQKIHFIISQGGWLCGNCIANSDIAVVVNGNTIDYLYQLESCSLESIDHIACGTNTGKESSLLLNKFMAYHIESLATMKSVAFLQDVQRD